MGRWARGNEIPCSAGGCKNLAEWKVYSDTLRGSGAARRHDEACKTWVFCGHHVYSSVRLLIERQQCRKPEIEPFQSTWDPPPRKRKHGCVESH